MNIRGKDYEDLVSDFLSEKGHKIIFRNFNSRFGEIDIISVKDNILHFIEVKARKSDSLYYPAESVTISKIRKIRSTAKFFLLRNKDFNNWIIQFDVAEYIIDRKTVNIIENCFY